MEGSPPPHPEIPLFLVIARILIVTGMSLFAAAAVFLLVGGIWEFGLPALALSAVFLGLMFLVERAAA
jgi:hypothetical protein